MKDSPASVSVDSQGTPEPEEGRWMALVAAGNDEALRSLIAKHYDAVYGTVTKLLGDPTEAQDVTQKVFVKIYRSASSYRSSAPFRAWLFTIVKNVVFDERKRRGRDKIYLNQYVPRATEPASSPLDEMPDKPHLSPDRAEERRELMRVVDSGILALPEQQRLALVLYCYNEMSYDEIAAILGATPNAVKSLLARARERLRAELQPFLD